MKYLVEGGVAEVGTDMVIGLTEEQASVRAHALEKVDGGWRPTKIVQFKAGETIGLDADFETLPRTLRSVLVPVEKPKGGKPKGPAGEAGVDA